MLRLSGVTVGSGVEYEEGQSTKSGRVFFIYRGEKDLAGVLSDDGRLNMVPLDVCQLCLVPGHGADFDVTGNKIERSTV